MSALQDNLKDLGKVDAEFALKRLMLGVSVLVGCVCLLVSFLPIETLISHLLYEDAFYYLQLARNAVNGLGVTLDGFEQTNGFHPLWLLICMAAEKLFGGGSLHMLMILSGALHIAQAFLMYNILMRRSSGIAAGAAALFWMLNYRVFASNMCGLETPLSVCSVLLCLYFLERLAFTSLRDWGVMGGALGIATLSRFDLLLFVPISVCGVVWLKARARPICLRGGLVLTAAYLLLLLPWFGWSCSTSGKFLPNSRRALELVRHCGVDWSSLSVAELHRQFVLDVTWLPDTANLFGLYPFVLPGKVVSLSLSLVMLCLFLIIPAAIWYFLKEANRRVALLLWGYSSLHFGYYSIGAYPEVRYLMPACAALTVGLAILMGAGLNRSTKARIAITVLCAILFVSAGTAGVAAWKRGQGATRTHLAHLELLETARSLKANVPADSVIGSWNAGILSYYSGLTVVNLDGCVNDAALAANENRLLSAYIEERGITHLVEFYTEMFRLMDNYSGDLHWRDSFEPMMLHEDGRIMVLERKLPHIEQ